MRIPRSRTRLSNTLAACAVVSALAASTLAGAAPVVAHGGEGHHEHSTRAGVDTAEKPAADSGAKDKPEAKPEAKPEDKPEVDPAEVAVLGREHAEEHATTRAGAEDLGTYPQATRTARLKMLTETQAEINKDYKASDFGAFKEYFDSPDFGVHIAQLPTGKVLLFSFERIETDPTKETAPTQVVGAPNRGRAYLWDPEKGTGERAFKKVTPPAVTMPDSTGVSRPAPIFCAGHAFLPNGMLGVFGGNLGGNGGSGAKLSFVFDPWSETWAMNEDMSVGRWYPSVVTGPDGRMLIMSGQSELGWGTPTPIVERFPALSDPVPYRTTDVPRFQSVDRFRADAPYKLDYPHLFSLRDGKIYGLGRSHDQQWLFDPVKETRSDLAQRPGAMNRSYGSAVPLPGGFRGPDSVLVLGGDRTDPNTYQLAAGKWKTKEARAFGRTQDNTLLLPTGNLLTVNGSYDIRDYGNGQYNPNADLKYRHTELRDENGDWRLGPVQRLARGYHSNAVVLPDGRVMVTGDEAQQIANDRNIKDDLDGTIEMYEPSYLHNGARPELDSAPSGPLGYDERFTVSSSTTDEVKRAVLLAPTTATHSVNTSQRHLELRIKRQGNGELDLQAPPTAEAAPPGWYMLFLLNEEGVPSIAKWISLEPDEAARS